MDYRQKMVVPSSQKYNHEDDDDEDLEALRMAALKSLKAKTPGASIKPTAIIQQPTISQTHMPFPSYNNQRVGLGSSRRDYYYPNRPLRQNGNVYHPSRNNQNLIEIIPVEENQNPPESNANEKISVDGPLSTESKDGSKFHRYADNASGSDEEDARDTKDSIPSKSVDKPECDNIDDVEIDKENQSGIENSSVIEENDTVPEEDEEDEEEDEDKDDDDDDVLLMADLEEEDSLERLMDEMEREMTEDKPKSEKKEKKCSRKDIAKESKKSHESIKSRTNKLRERTDETEDNSSTASYKNEQRPGSPYGTNKILGKHRSVSPKLKLRKKSPRRSPPSRRSSPPQARQLKKSQRDIRLRSPRKSPPKYSPRPRSPKLSPRSRSPRISPRRSPIRRSPQRKLSPRGMSQSRSPLRRHSRSRSPRVIRLRSPRNSPLRVSPRPRSPFHRSPKVSPHHLSPRRLSPRSRSPKLSPRRTSPLLSRARSPKLSPSRRVSPRARSPSRPSPHKSPWSSPRNSPRLSPRRRRSPPKESSKKNRQRSITPDNVVGVINHKRENTPIRRNPTSPELSRNKIKVLSINKELSEITNDPVLEARRRKFESTKPIDPVHDNKKIKLSRKESVNVFKKSLEILENAPETNSPHRNTHKISEDNYELPEAELCLHDNYDFDELGEHISDESTLTNAVTICVEESPVKVEKERVKKKKKKDKELYQVGKLKGGELPLSERIGKEKKCKKRKEIIDDDVKEEVDAVVDESLDDEADLRTELSRRRAERLNRTAPMQSARLLQSAFKGLAKEVVKDSAKAMQRSFTKGEEKSNSKDIRRVTVLHRAVPDLDNSDDDETLDSKIPIRFRLGINKPIQETRESKGSRKSSKRQGRKGTKKNTH